MVEPEFHILQFDGEHFLIDSLYIQHSRLKILYFLQSQSHHSQRILILLQQLPLSTSRFSEIYLNAASRPCHWERKTDPNAPPPNLISSASLDSKNEPSYKGLRKFRFDEILNVLMSSESMSESSLGAS